MKEKFQWLTDSVNFPQQLPFKEIECWIERVAANHGRVVGMLNYIFCSDEKILEVNREFLDHDYYTDIITFDNTRRKQINGDIFISLETVATNAQLVGQPYERELRRVIIHGVLHLCGINDKGPGEREVMEAHENTALAMLDC